MSKRSWFNRTLFFSHLRRFWPMWAAFALVLFLTVPVQLLTNAHSPELLRTCALNGSIAAVWPLIAIEIFAMSAAAAMGMFSHLYLPRQTELIAALPVRREAVFLSCFAAGFAGMAAAEVLIILVTGILEAAMGVFCAKFLWILLAQMLLTTIALYGFAAFCAMLTGNILVLPAVYFVLNITGGCLNLLLGGYLVQYFVYGHIQSADLLLDWLSPVWILASHLPVRLVTGTPSALYAFAPAGLGIAAVYAALGFLITFAALQLYRRRKMESVGNVVAIRVLRPIFRYCMAFGCAVIGASIFCFILTENDYSVCYVGTGHFFGLFLCAALGAFIGYFAAAMLEKKSLRVFRGGLPHWGICCAVLALLILGVRFDINGYETRVPDRDSISNVSFRLNGTTAELDGKEDIDAVLALHEDLIDNRAAYSRMVTGSTGSESYDVPWTVTLTYTLQSGKTMTRSYNIFPDTEADRLTCELLTTQAYQTAYLRVSVPVTADTVEDAEITYLDNGETRTLTLTAAQGAALYDAMQQDLADGNMRAAAVYNYSANTGTNSASGEVYDCTIWLSVREPAEDGDYDYLDFTLPTAAEHTLTWLEENTDFSRDGLPKMQEAAQLPAYNAIESGLG